MVPLDQLLVETDAPFLTPVPYRGRPNAPYLVPLTVRALAAVKDCPHRTLVRGSHPNGAAGLRLVVMVHHGESPNLACRTRDVIVPRPMDGNSSPRGRHRHRVPPDEPAPVEERPQWMPSSDRPQWTPGRPDERVRRAHEVLGRRRSPSQQTDWFAPLPADPPPPARPGTGPAAWPASPPAEPVVGPAAWPVSAAEPAWSRPDDGRGGWPAEAAGAVAPPYRRPATARLRSRTGRDRHRLLPPAPAGPPPGGRRPGGPLPGGRAGPARAGAPGPAPGPARPLRARPASACSPAASPGSRWTSPSG